MDDKSERLATDRLESLASRKAEIERKIKYISISKVITLVAGFLLILFALLLLAGNTGKEKIEHVTESMIVGCSLLGVSQVLLARAQLLEQQLQDVEFESDLIRFLPLHS